MLNKLKLRLFIFSIIILGGVLNTSHISAQTDLNKEKPKEVSPEEQKRIFLNKFRNDKLKAPEVIAEEERQANIEANKKLDEEAAKKGETANTIENALQDFKQTGNPINEMFKGMPKGKVIELQKAIQSGDMSKIKDFAKNMSANATPEQKKAMNAQIQKVVKSGLTNFQKGSLADVQKTVEERAKGTFAANFFKRGTKLNLFAAKMMRDKNAIPKFLEIIQHRKTLITYGILNLCTFVLGFYLSKRLNKKLDAYKMKKKKQPPFFMSFGGKLKRTGILLTIRIALLVIFLGEFLGPGFNVFKEVFLKDLI